MWLQRLAALEPILAQYLLLHDKAMTDLMVAHCTLSKTLSILLATFATLVAKVGHGGNWNPSMWNPQALKFQVRILGIKILLT